MDIQLITTVTLAAIATPVRLHPLAASFSMTHVSIADKIASYLRSPFFVRKRKTTKEKEIKPTHSTLSGQQCCRDVRTTKLTWMLDHRQSNMIDKRLTST